jgi:hypothetical protein
VKKVYLIQALECSHPQKGFQQCEPPRDNISVELEAEDLETASGAADLFEDFDPEATAHVDTSRDGELCMYLESNVSKVDLIPPANPSEPRVRISGAFGSSVSRVHMIPGRGRIW